MTRHVFPNGPAVWIGCAVAVLTVSIAVAQTAAPPADASHAAPPAAAAPSATSPAATSTALDTIRKVVVDLGFKITATTDSTLEFSDKDDDYEISLSDDKSDVYVSSWVDVPKGKENRIPYAALLRYNNESREYYSVGRTDEGSLYVGINDRVRLAEFSAATLKEAMGVISDNLDNHPDLTDPDTWK